MFIGPFIVSAFLFGTGLFLTSATALGAFLPAAIYYAIHLKEGNAVTPVAVGRRLDVTLPRELPITALIDIIDGIAERFLSFGVPVQADLHITGALDGKPNPHAHLLIAERRLLGDQFERIKCQDVIASFRTGFGRPLRLRLSEIINQVAQESGFPEPLVSASPIAVDRMTEPRMARREFKSKKLTP